MLRELEARPLGLPDGLELEWLGVAGYRLTYEGVSVFVDPYVSRVPLRSLLLRRPALPDEALIERYVRPPGPVAGVLSGTRTGITRSMRPRSRSGSAAPRTGRTRWRG